MFTESFKGVLKKFKCFKGVSRKYQRSYKEERFKGIRVF